MSDTINLSTVLPVKPERLYFAWLDSEEHGLFTGGAAEIDPRPGGPYTAWDGYIQGITLELETGKRILQTWRTSDFPANSPDSRVELIFEAIEDGVRLVLNHTDIPEGQADEYKQGWYDYYLEPMSEYFNGL